MLKFTHLDSHSNKSVNNPIKCLPLIKHTQKQGLEPHHLERQRCVRGEANYTYIHILVLLHQNYKLGVVVRGVIQHINIDTE